jgi:hypothetical protein
VVIGVVSVLVVPRGQRALASPAFDSASVEASVDPPAVSPVPTAAGPVAGPEVQPVNVPLPLKPTVPVGKGMWVHVLDRVTRGNVQAMVNHAVEYGVTHVYVRLGSSKKGFYAQRDLDALLPLAHKAGVKVIGWDYPYLQDPIADAERATGEIAYTTADGHQIDGFAADIETPSEGTNLTVDGARAYGSRLRELAGPQVLLIAAVPRPDARRWYPYDVVTEHFDAIAPMVYWVNRDPGADVAGAIATLAPLGKPVLPVGQAYDPGIDGSHAWPAPSTADLHRFMRTAGDLGVASYSFWSWDTANADQWRAIAESDVIDVQPLAPNAEPGGRVAALQRVLKGLGRPVAVDGTFGSATLAALQDLQRQLGVPVTGVLDAATVQALQRPRRNT